MGQAYQVGYTNRVVPFIISKSNGLAEPLRKDLTAEPLLRWQILTEMLLVERIAEWELATVRPVDDAFVIINIEVDRLRQA